MPHPLSPVDNRSPWTPGALALGLLTMTACPADVVLEEGSTGTGSTSVTGGGSEQVTGGGPGTLTTTGPEPGSSTGATTAELSGVSTGDSTGATTDTSTSGGTTTDASTSTTTGDGTTGGTTDGTTDGTSTTSTTTSTTGEPDSTSDPGTTGEPDTTGGDEIPGFEIEKTWCCDVGCRIPLMQTHTGYVEVHHGGKRIATHDGVKNLRLWSADKLDMLMDVADVDAVAFVGQTLMYEKGGMLHIVDASDVTELGTCPADVQWGVALDGSYVWTAGAAGLELLELDCSLRWSAAGDLGDAKVKALADGVHVADPDLGAQTAVYFDAVDGSASAHEFLGTFGGWFGDSARHWTTQGGAYRAYDVDGTLLKLAMGQPKHGWGSRMAGNGQVWDLFAPDYLAKYDAVTGQFSGPAVMSYIVGTGQIELLRLDLDPPTPTVINPACCIDSISSVWNFGFAEGAWVVGGPGGYAVDQLGRPLGPSQVSYLEGSQVGRVAVGLWGGPVVLFDLDDDCNLKTYSSFERGSAASIMRMSADGTSLVSAEAWPPPGKAAYYSGARFYKLPGGLKLGEHQLGLLSDSMADLGITEDAKRWTYTKFNGMWQWATGLFPGPASGDTGNVMPKYAPGGLSRATTNALPPPWGWDEGFTYIYSGIPSVLVGVVDGVPHGFIDDQHLLVGRYEDPQKFLGSVFVGVNGVVLQATNLPDIHRFERLGTGEILAEIQPDKHWAILDPFTGDVLWAAPPKAQAALAGPNHVATNDAAGVQLIKWR